MLFLNGRICRPCEVWSLLMTDVFSKRRNLRLLFIQVFLILLVTIFHRFWSLWSKVTKAFGWYLFVIVSCVICSQIGRVTFVNRLVYFPKRVVLFLLNFYSTQSWGRNVFVLNTRLLRRVGISSKLSRTNIWMSNFTTDLIIDRLNMVYCEIQTSAYGLLCISHEHRSLYRVRLLKLVLWCSNLESPISSLSTLLIRSILETTSSIEVTSS